MATEILRTLQYKASTSVFPKDRRSVPQQCDPMIATSVAALNWDRKSYTCDGSQGACAPSLPAALDALAESEACHDVNRRGTRTYYTTTIIALQCQINQCSTPNYAGLFMTIPTNTQGLVGILRPSRNSELSISLMMRNFNLLNPRIRQTLTNRPIISSWSMLCGFEGLHVCATWADGPGCWLIMSLYHQRLGPSDAIPKL